MSQNGGKREGGDVSCAIDNVTVPFVVAHTRALQTKLSVYFVHPEGKEEKSVCVRV